MRPFDAIAAAATTLGNVGPGFGFAGPMGSFDPYSDFSKLVMIVLMWLGRLEIIPVVVLFTEETILDAALREGVGASHPSPSVRALAL